MTEDIQKDSRFYQKNVKINGMTKAWDVFDVYDKEVILEGKKHPKGFRFFNSTRRNDEETASGAFQLHLETVFVTECDCYNLRNRMDK